MFDRLLVGEWAVPTDEFMKARELWVMYYAFTDAYDETICAGRRDGVAIPVTPWERSASTRFAREAHRLMQSAAAAHQLTSEVMEAARRQVNP